jgi:hypothetical protein
MTEKKVTLFTRCEDYCKEENFYEAQQMYISHYHKFYK